MIFEAALFVGGLMAASVVKKKRASGTAETPRVSGGHEARQILGDTLRGMGGVLGDVARSGGSTAAANVPASQPRKRKAPKPGVVPGTVKTRGPKKKAKTGGPKTTRQHPGSAPKTTDTGKPTKGWVKQTEPRRAGEGVEFGEVLDGFADLVRYEGRRPWQRDPNKPRKVRFWQTSRRTVREGAEAARSAAEAEESARRERISDYEKSQRPAVAQPAQPKPVGAGVPAPRVEATPIRVVAPPVSEPGKCVHCGRPAQLRDADRAPRWACSACYVTGPSPMIRVTTQEGSSIVSTPAFLGVFEASDAICRPEFTDLQQIESWLERVADGAAACVSVYTGLAVRLVEELNIDPIVTTPLEQAAGSQQHVSGSVKDSAAALHAILNMSVEELLDRGMEVPDEQVMEGSGGEVVVPEFYAKLSAAASSPFDRDPRRALDLLAALRDASRHQSRMYGEIANHLADHRIDGTVRDHLTEAESNQDDVTARLADAESQLEMLLTMALRKLIESGHQVPVAQPS